MLGPLVLVSVAMSGFATPAQAASRLERIRDRGYLSCGVAPEVAGFASLDAVGRVQGFEPDLCRAVSAAIFGGPDKVKFVAAASLKDFKDDPTLDLVARRLTLTLRREADADLAFSPIVFYDGAGFLVAKNSPWRDPARLGGRRICVARGSETQAAVSAFFSRTHIRYEEIAASSVRQAADAFFAGRCDALSADLSQLAAARAKHPGGVAAYNIAPRLISKEPLALLMHRDDRQFSQIVRWTIFALIEAEELDIRSSNLREQKASHDPEIAAFMGTAPGNGRALGLDERWAANVIAAVGDYGELYDRDLGVNSPIKLNRGLNALWTNGGLLYAPPLR